jgi:DNA (cytosine-5)-methyltransferase 1
MIGGTYPPVARPAHNPDTAGRDSLRVLSMFSGIGAMDLGLQRAGLDIVAQCEVDPYACAVLLERFPGVPNLGDVTKAAFDVDADMIAAGFPCQDISNAGKRAGLAGSRSGLFWEVMRAVRMVRPRVILLENVAALHGRDLGTVFGALAAIGYDASADCIPASHVGAPHNRDRTWIVAHAIGSEWRQEPYRRALGRMGRVQQSVPWDRDWQSALREFRGVDDGSAYRVDRVDTIRNAVVPQIPELIGRAILHALNAPVNDRAGQPANRDGLPAGQSASSFHGDHHA